MREKYIVYPQEGIAFGIRFNAKKQELLIGGFTSLRSEMVNTALSFFSGNLHSLTYKGSRRGRVQVLLSCNTATFDIGINKMKEIGIIINPVRTFGRLMT